MQHYGFKCRKPEYVLDKILFPRVWARLQEALNERDVLLAGLETNLRELEASNEFEELKRFERRLEQLRERELSYADQRADGSISKSIHHELMMRLKDERKEVLQAQAQLKQKAQLIEEARQQKQTAHALIEALPEILPEMPHELRERLVTTLTSHVDVDG